MQFQFNPETDKWDRPAAASALARAGLYPLITYLVKRREYILPYAATIPDYHQLQARNVIGETARKIFLTDDPDLRKLAHKIRNPGSENQGFLRNFYRRFFPDNRFSSVSFILLHIHLHSSSDAILLIFGQYHANTMRPLFHPPKRQNVLNWESLVHTPGFLHHHKTKDYI